MGAKVYDANEVTVNFGGVDIDSGYAEGEFCKIEQDDDDFTDKVGTDGEVTRSKTNDRRATITVILMQSSDGNGKLSAINHIDREANNGAGIAPVLVRDRQGTSIYTGAEAWLAGPPKTVSFGKDASAREWKIRVAKLNRFDGGN